MAKEPWTRNEKLAFGSLFIAILSCAAAVVVIPEVRKFAGLQNAEISHSDNRKVNAAANVLTSLANHSSSTDNRGSGPSRTPLPADVRIRGVKFSPDVSDDFYATGLDHFEVKLLRWTLGSEQKVYIKLFFCNRGSELKSINNLYIWFTPQGQETINWKWENFDPLLTLKPAECKPLEDRSENSREYLTKPIGRVSIAVDTPHKEHGWIDLKESSSDEFVP
jgi:hypothetical protein